MIPPAAKGVRVPPEKTAPVAAGAPAEAARRPPIHELAPVKAVSATVVMAFSMGFSTIVRRAMVSRLCHISRSSGLILAPWMSAPSKAVPMADPIWFQP